MPDIWGVAAIVAKFTLYIGITGASGLVIIRIVYANLVMSLQAHMRVWTGFLCCLASVAVVLGFMLRGAAMTGDIGGMIDLEMLGLLWSTQVGTALVLRLLGIGLILIGLYLPLVGKWVALAGSVVALWSFGQVGHLSEEAHTGLRVLLLVHLVGVSFWVGILWPLRHLARDTKHLATAASLGHRFGNSAAWIVPILLIAGVLLAWQILGNVWMIVSTAYGLALLGKVVLVTALLGIATVNKLRFVPDMRAGDHSAAQKLVRALEIECGVIALVFGTTATLTSILTLPI